MTSYLKIFVLIDFHFQGASCPFKFAAPEGVKHHGSTESRREREERGASPRSRPSPALLRCRASGRRCLVRSATETQDLTRRA